MSTKATPRSRDKEWDMKFTHAFRTSYSSSPDIHAFVYLCGARLNEVMENALRDYMSKHASPALDRDFRTRLVIAASERAAHGLSTLPVDVLAQVDAAGSIPIRPPTAGPINDPHRPTPVATAPASTVVPVLTTAAQPQPQPTVAKAMASVQAAPTTQPAADMDFGPAEILEDGVQDLSAQHKPSKRDRWLARHM